MESLIRMMNEIQKALSDAKLQYKIDLPWIAAIGAQSSGKSSVLESIVKEDFLPRGTGIVTRCTWRLFFNVNNLNILLSLKLKFYSFNIIIH